MIIYDQWKFGMCVGGVTDARVHVRIHVWETFHMMPVWGQCLGGPAYPRMIKWLGERAQPRRDTHMFLIIRVPGKTAHSTLPDVMIL